MKPTHPEEKEHSGDAETGEDEKTDKEVSWQRSSSFGASNLGVVHKLRNHF